MSTSVTQATSNSVTLTSSPSPFSVPVSSLPSMSPHATYESISPLPPMTVAESPGAMLREENQVNSADTVPNFRTTATSVESPPPAVSMLPSATDQRNLSLNSELLDLQEMLSGELNTMEWNSDEGFVGLDLGEASKHIGSGSSSSVGGSGDSGMGSSLENTLTGPPASHDQGSVNGSEPDLTSLGLQDGDGDTDMTGMGMQMDVSDWLDVIMPNTGLTPLSTNAPVSFSADPVLTPKTQQEVLDLFNFDDGDSVFHPASDGSSGLSWDRLTEPGTSSR